MRAFKKKPVEKVEQLTRHHLVPRAVGGTDLPENIVLVPRRQHFKWHALMGILPPEEVVKIVNTYLPVKVKIV